MIDKLTAVLDFLTQYPNWVKWYFISLFIFFAIGLVILFVVPRQTVGNVIEVKVDSIPANEIVKEDADSLDLKKQRLKIHLLRILAEPDAGIMTLDALSHRVEKHEDVVKSALKELGDEKLIIFSNNYVQYEEESPKVFSHYSAFIIEAGRTFLVENGHHE